jgi:hypothetical protein
MRALWLIAPALLWPLGVVVYLRRGRPGVGDVRPTAGHELELAEVAGVGYLFADGAGEPTAARSLNNGRGSGSARGPPTMSECGLVARSRPI